MNNSTTFEFNCSNKNLTSVPSGLGKELQQMPPLQQIVLNFDNNDISSLPDSTMPKFELIKKITAKNNSIKSIDVDNLPPNLMEIDISDNKLESLSTTVIDKVYSEVKFVLAGNPWTCDDAFFDFVRLNREKVDFENIVCNDGELFYLKHDRLAFWITDVSVDVIRPEWRNSNEVIRKLPHEAKYDGRGKICPPECNCLITQKNTKILYKCSAYSFSRILNHFHAGESYWPLIKHRQLVL